MYFGFKVSEHVPQYETKMEQTGSIKYHLLVVFYITDINWTQELGKCEESTAEIDINLFISQDFFSFQVQIQVRIFFLLLSLKIFFDQWPLFLDNICGHDLTFF